MSGEIELLPSRALSGVVGFDAGGLAGQRPEVFVYPESFGAIPDGVTDNTSAIQAAIDAAYVSGGGTLVYSEGVYLTGPLTSRPRVSHFGAVPPVFNETSTSQSGAILRLKTGSTAPLLSNNPDSGDAAFFRQNGLDGEPQYYHLVQLKDLTFDANAAQNFHSSADGVRFERAWGVKIDGCYIKGSQRSFAIRILDCNIVVISGGTTTIGPSFFHSMADSIVTGNFFGGGTANGLSVFWPCVWLASAECWLNVVTDNLIYNNTGNGGGPTLNFTLAGSTLLTTDEAHFLNDLDPVICKTTGTLPTGVVESTVYFVKRVGGTQLRLCTSRKNVKDGVYITFSGGTGTHELRGGENCNIYVQQATQNQINDNRVDQAYGAGIIVDNANANQINSNSVNQSGKGNAGAAAEGVDIGIHLKNNSDDNIITGNLLDGGIANANQNIGILVDAGCDGNALKPNMVRRHATVNARVAGTDYTSLVVSL